MKLNFEFDQSKIDDIKIKLKDELCHTYDMVKVLGKWKLGK